MTDSPPLLASGRRHRMRDLRTADVPDVVHGVEVPVLASGRALSENSFLASLGQAIATASGTDQQVLVFRTRGSAIGLHKWSEPPAPGTDQLESIIEDRLLAVDPSIVILRLAGDVLGFASQPRDRESAERLGGALAANLAVAVGEPGPQFALAPRLGVAIVEGPIPGAARLARAVAGAVEAVERTIDQTSAETPYLVHTDYIRRRSLRQDEIGANLQQALAERQITLEFQPRIAVPDRCPVGLEVFPRWTHPELGPVATIDFLRVAEASGHLGALGRRVRADAMDMARRWAVDGSLGDRRLWFDVAPVEILDPGFVDEVAGLVDARPDVAVGFELADCALLEGSVFEPVFDVIEELEVVLALDNVRP
ncbi:MAG: EAL domain-containing protein, partial [Actinomycetota bacterium]